MEVMTFGLLALILIQLPIDYFPMLILLFSNLAFLLIINQRVQSTINNHYK
ncbi:hypothetical protein IV37_GL000841 [Fructilactobacillus fructivorans]|nr:hypothetical protein IV37_GL000841 [Fructilactobacillus fructivorans]